MRKTKYKTDYRHVLDLAIRAVLALFFAYSAGVYFKNALYGFGSFNPAEMTAHEIAKSFSILGIGLYTMMIATLYVLRLRPISKFAGIWPCLAAILGGFLISALLLVPPRYDLPLAAQIAASVLILLGNIMAVIILTRLGRSFSILPESRRLVTTGPYRIVRHPLYLAEAIANLGVLINFWSPLACAIVAAQMGMQLVRIHYEERVLRQTFPEYKAYAKRTARLIPGVY